MQAPWRAQAACSAGARRAGGRVRADSCGGSARLERHDPLRGGSFGGCCNGRLRCCQGRQRNRDAAVQGAITQRQLVERKAVQRGIMVPQQAFQQAVGVGMVRMHAVRCVGMDDPVQMPQRGHGHQGQQQPQQRDPGQRGPARSGPQGVMVGEAMAVHSGQKGVVSTASKRAYSTATASSTR